MTGAQGTGDSVGSVQFDQFAGHRHAGITDVENLPDGTLGIWYDNPGQNRFPNSGGVGAAQNIRHSHNFTTDIQGGKETRPHNISVDYIIKL